METIFLYPYFLINIKVMERGKISVFFIPFQMVLRTNIVVL